MGSSPIVHVELSATGLDVESLRAIVATPSCGGVVVFEGTVRSPNHGVEVLALEYEAWEERAVEQMRGIAERAAARAGVGGVAVAHRTGLVGVGEPAVVVAVAGEHRDEAFSAAREAIDRVKTEAAIWKREITHEGGRWLEGC